MLAENYLVKVFVFIVIHHNGRRVKNKKRNKLIMQKIVHKVDVSFLPTTYWSWFR